MKNAIIILTFLLILSLIIAINSEFSNRIIGGQIAPTAQFPWQVSLYYNNGAQDSHCSGSLISTQWILTAAHCMIGVKSVIIFFGDTTFLNLDTSSKIVTATEFDIHPQYNNVLLHYDVALIKLPYNINLSNTVQTIQLPEKGDVVGENVFLTASGWGKTSSDASNSSYYLKYTYLQTISNDLCAHYYPQYIIPASICTIGTQTGICNGDSGGPLVKWTKALNLLVGVISFVNQNCDTRYASGNTRTEPILDWIYSTTGIIH